MYQKKKKICQLFTDLNSFDRSFNVSLFLCAKVTHAISKKESGKRMRTDCKNEIQ